MSGLGKKYFITDAMCDDIIDHINAGHVVYLQWECVGCGDKITSDDPIKLVKNAQGVTCVALYRVYRHGERDDGVVCNSLTPLTVEAFNYMVIAELRVR